MKKILLAAIVVLNPLQIIISQMVTQKSKPIAEIFTDFRLNLNDTTKTTGFGLNRAYFGYNYTPEEHFSGTIIVNVGTPDDLAPGSAPKRYAYFREASISYTDESLKIAFGITSTRLFDFQQKFWGKRYIANTYQSINGYGFVADLGIAVDYKFNDMLKADLTIMNGEGYNNIAIDNNIRTAFGLNINPMKTITIRLYGDVERVKGLWRPMFIGFAGYKNENLTIGAEVTYKSNLDTICGHHAWGISGTAGLTVAKKTELFLRYDYSTSRVPQDDILPWNYNKDGVFLITGLQYSFTDNIKFAIDYQGTHPYYSGRNVSEAVFLNALFRF